MKPTDELRDQVQHARAKLETSLSAVSDQLAPQQLMERSMSTLKSEFPSLADGAVNFVKENPLAIGVTLGGLAWLAFGGGPSTNELRAGQLGSGRGFTGNGGSGYPGDNAFDVYADDKYAGDYTTHHLNSDSSESLGDKAFEMAAEARRKASEKAAMAGEKLSEVGADMMGRSSDAAHEFAERARPMAGIASREISQRPLAVAGVALLAGVVVGLALPSSRAEKKLMGEKSQAARANAALQARRALHQAEVRAKAAADDIAGTLKSAAGIDEVAGEAPNGEEPLDKSSVKTKADSATTLAGQA